MSDLADLAARLLRASRVTVLTGAGVSAASGVPTFRGADGLWRHFRPEDLATPRAFARDPRLVWEWYDWRRSRIAGCRPNRAHQVLAAWSSRFPRFTLITQNVDGLHEAAGASSLVRLHGSIWQVRCATPCAAGAAAWRDDRVPLEPLPPSCPHCHALVRPDVVWFGESLDSAIVRRASGATECDLFLVIGTSAVVYPAAGLIGEAQHRGAFTVEINPEATEVSAAVDLAIRAPAEMVLDELDARLESRTPPAGET
jgi:NAD-dependent protein deacetylase/lipoamidase